MTAQPTVETAVKKCIEQIVQKAKTVWAGLFENGRNNILGWFRFLYCLAIAAEVWFDRGYLQLKHQSPFCSQLEVFQILALPEVGAVHFEILIWTLVAALICASLGFGRRLPLLVSVLLFGYVLGSVVGCDRGVNGAYTASNHIIVWQNLLILLVAPGINSWKPWFRLQQTFESYPVRWPVELLKFNLVFAYFAGGVSKVRGGLEWMNGYSLQYHLLDRHLSLDIPLALSFASSWWLCFVSSVFIVLLELTCLIVFFMPRLTGFYVGTFFGLQIFWMFLMKLHWMKYFGWSYLIYALELAVFVFVIGKRRFRPTV